MTDRSNEEVAQYDFQDAPIRVVEESGEVLFCGKDVAIAIGYQDLTNAVKLHCKGGGDGECC